MCVCLSVCLSVCAQRPVNGSSMLIAQKRLKLRTWNLTKVFPGTVRTLPQKFFQKGAWPWSRGPLNFSGLNANAWRRYALSWAPSRYLCFVNNLTACENIVKLNLLSAPEQLYGRPHIMSALAPTSLLLFIQSVIYNNAQWGSQGGTWVHVPSPRHSWKFFQSIIGLRTVRDLWRSVAMFSRIFSVCLRLRPQTPRRSASGPRWGLPSPRPTVLSPSPLANSWLRPS